MLYQVVKKKNCLITSSAVLSQRLKCCAKTKILSSCGRWCSSWIEWNGLKMIRYTGRGTFQRASTLFTRGQSGWWLKMAFNLRFTNEVKLWATKKHCSIYWETLRQLLRRVVFSIFLKPRTVKRFLVCIPKLTLRWNRMLSRKSRCTQKEWRMPLKNDRCSGHRAK